MRSIRQILAGIMALMILVPAAAAPAGAADPIKLSYANFPPAPTFPCVQMERWKQEVEKRTGGAVAINTFPGGTLLDAKNMMDGVIAGQADIGCLCMAYQPGRFVITGATGLPLGLPNAHVASMVLWDLYNKHKPKEFEQVKVLTMFTSAPANIMSKKPVRSLPDLKGMNLRASGDAAKVLGTWGANQVGMPMSETPEALQKGVVQGLFSSLEVLKDFKFAETCRYATITETSVYPFAVVMNAEKWKALSAEVQKVMEELGAEQAAWTGKYMDEHVKESIAWSKENYKLEVIKLPQLELDRWNKMLTPLAGDWIKDAKAKGLPAETIIKDIGDLKIKYSAK